MSVEAAPYPARIDITDLRMATGTTPAVSYTGLGDGVGLPVSPVGDVNGDGLADIALGAAQWLTGYPYPPRRVYLLNGRSNARTERISLRAITELGGGDGSDGSQFLVDEPYSFVGRSLADLGDVNGDDFDDLLITNPGSGGSSQDFQARLYLVFGREEGFAAEFDLTSAVQGQPLPDGVSLLLGSDAGHDHAGASIAGCDINGDDLNDIVISASANFYILFGATDLVQRTIALDSVAAGTTAGAVIDIEEVNASLNNATCAGDLDADGDEELMFQARSQAFDGALVVFGDANLGASGHIDPLNLLPVNGGDGSDGFAFAGDRSEQVANALAAQGDFDGDGRDDFLIGADAAAPGDNEYAGRVYLVFGADSYPAQFNLNDLLTQPADAALRGIVFEGDASNAGLGHQLDFAGDINNDGYDDLLLAANNEIDWSYYFGDAYLIYGTGTPLNSTFNVEQLRDGEHADLGSWITQPDKQLVLPSFYYVSRAGDFNGDAVDDFVLGSPYYGQSGGAVLVFGLEDPDDDDAGHLVDNCTAQTNVAQRDTDDDGIGNVCDYDLNNDCRIDFADLLALSEVFASDDENADFNGDGTVDANDLRLMKASFFGAPGPSGTENLCDND